MARKIASLILMVFGLLLFARGAEAHSFEGTVLSKINLDGSVIVTLNQIGNRVPSTMTLTAATLEGNPEISVAAGSHVGAQAAAQFPIAHISPLSVGKRVRVSWIPQPSGEMLDPAVMTASFEGKVLSKISLDGSLIYTIHQVANRFPTNLSVTTATIEGTADISEAQGTHVPSSALVSFPIDDVSSLDVGDAVRLSWVGTPSGEMHGLRLTTSGFEARVLSQTVVDGSLIFTLHQVRERFPSNLLMTSATIEGSPDVSEPAGTAAVGSVVATFPIDDVSGMHVGAIVRLSWQGDISGELMGLRIVAPPP